MAVTLSKSFNLHPVHNDPEFRAAMNTSTEEFNRSLRVANAYDNLGDVKYGRWDGMNWV